MMILNSIVTKELFYKKNEKVLQPPTTYPIYILGNLWYNVTVRYIPI